MRINYRQFPHPVLSYFSDDFVDKAFQATLKSSQLNDNYNFEAFCTTSSEMLNQLIAEKRATFAFHFECPATRYRKVFSSNDSEFFFQINSNDVEGNVQICPLILATEDIDNYRSEEFHSDYLGHTFKIKKGDVLAVDVEKSFFAEKDVDPLRRIPSIFTIKPDRNPDASSIDIELTGNKIIVKLSEANFDYYKSLTLNQHLQPLLTSLIILPALIYVLETIKNGEQEIEYEEYRWYQVIKRRLKEMDIDAYNLNAHLDSTLLIAQKLIGNPLDTSLLALVNYDEEG